MRSYFGMIVLWRQLTRTSEGEAKGGLGVGWVGIIVGVEGTVAMLYFCRWSEDSGGEAGSRADGNRTHNKERVTDFCKRHVAPKRPKTRIVPSMSCLCGIFVLAGMARISTGTAAVTCHYLDTRFSTRLIQ